MASATPAEPAGTWSTEHLAPTLRASAAREMLSRTHLPWSLRLDERAAYACRLDWCGLGGSTVIECRSAPLSGRRDRPEIARTQGDYVGLLLVLSGRERVRQGELAAELNAGDLLLWDGAQPLNFTVESPLHKVTMLVPRARMAASLSGGPVRGATRLDGRTGMGALARGHLAGLCGTVRDIPESDRPLASDLVVDLVGRLLDPGAGAPARGDLLAQMCAHIEARLDDPSLGPAALARAFGISTRYLHMVFAEAGQTPAGVIRRRRLARIHRDLADPRLADRTITEIVLRWGFNDPAHASRAFRQVYGMAPSRRRGSRR